jgi:hypothetical protein
MGTHDIFVEETRVRNRLGDIGVNERTLNINLRKIIMLIYIQVAQDRIYRSDFVNIKTVFKFNIKRRTLWLVEKISK